MLSESSLQRAMPIGVSCLLHAGLIVGLLSVQPLAVGMVAVRPPVLPVQLVTLDAPEPPREPAPTPPRPERAAPPRRIEPPRPREEPVVARIEEPAPPPARPVPAPPPAERATAPPMMTAPPAISEPERAPETSPPVASGSPLAGASLAAPPLSAPPLTLPSPQGTEGGGRVAKAPSAPAEDVTRAARPQGGYQVRPAYPSTPRRLGIQGTTMLRVHVLADGRIGDVLIARSAGHADLDQAAVEAVQRWRFEPARRGDDPVAMWVLLPVEFRLKR